MSPVTAVESIGGLPMPTEPLGPEGDTEGFGAALQEALGQAEAVTSEADAKADGLVSGEVGLHEAMVAMEKADIALRVGTTIRNKLLEAYRTLSQTG